VTAPPQAGPAADLEVVARGLGKRFRLPARQRSLLRALRALGRGEAWQPEWWVLREVDLAIRRGERLALVGRNGAGKTTLLRILCGIYGATAGRLWVRTRPRALFSAAAGLVGDLPVWDNARLLGAFHGIDPRGLGPRLPALLARVGLDHLARSPLRDLSTGQLQRLALAVFLEGPGDFLILDEALSHLDHGFRAACDAELDRVAGGRTVLMTSHDGAFLRRHCRRALWLDGGRIRLDGDVAEVLDAYEGAGAA
jgi:ABC-type polysaccharide/polyol phosphate transport system ATPase subunit